MNAYAELINRQQAEFDAFPMKYAFNQKQFERGMKELGLEPTDTDKIYKSPGGGFYRKTDAPALREMLDRFDREMQEAIAADPTGEGFIYEMFRYELDNHEYNYTQDVTETIECLGFTWEEINADERLLNGLLLATGKKKKVKEKKR